MSRTVSENCRILQGRNLPGVCRWPFPNLGIWKLSNPKVNKGIALEFLCKHYGLKPENCIAMGDGTIDAPMIEYAGLGVAMENADDMTKSVANLICPSNDEDGVAYIIDKYILGGETA